MNRRFITTFATVAAVPLAALAIAGCGGNSLSLIHI